MIAALLAAVMLICLLPTSVFAAGSKSYIVDKANMLSADENALLQQQIAELCGQMRHDILIYTDTCGNDRIADYAQDCYASGGYRGDCMILYVSYTDGACGVGVVGDYSAFTDAGLNHLINCTLELLGQGEFLAGFLIFAEMTYDFIVTAQTGAPYDGNRMPPIAKYLARCIDAAGVLTAEEVALYDAQLRDLARRYDLDMVAAIIPTLEDMTAAAFAEYYYDTYGFGYGSTHDGLMLVICPQDKVAYIHTAGVADMSFSNRTCNYILKQMERSLNNGSINAAVETFLAQSETFLNITANDNAYVYDYAGVISGNTHSIALTFDSLTDEASLDMIVVIQPTVENDITEEAALLHEVYSHRAGSQANGILLLIAADTGDMEFSRYGNAQTIFTDAGLAYIAGQLQPAVVTGNFAKAASDFAYTCYQFYQQAEDDTPYDTGNLPAPAPAPDLTFPVGDLNCDGKVNSVDARIALRAAARLQMLTVFQKQLGDVNGDGKVNSVDARLVLRIAARLDDAPDATATYA